MFHLIFRAFQCWVFALTTFLLVSKSLNEIVVFDKNKTIPSSFSEFKSATVIVIKDCKLTNFSSDQFSGIESLEELNITRSNLIALEGDLLFAGLRSLNALNLATNKISKISSNEFSNLIRLKKLLLNENQLTDIDKKLFKNNVDLEIISISSNNIEKLHFKTFSSLLKLKRINLSLNLLISLDSRLLENNVNLEVVDFSYNSLKEIDGNFFQTLVKLSDADFDKNVCIGWLKNDIASLNKTIIQNCTVSDKTRIEWLNDLVSELKGQDTDSDSDFSMARKNANLEENNLKLENELKESIEKTKTLESEKRNWRNQNCTESTTLKPINRVDSCQQEKDDLNEMINELQEKLDNFEASQNSTMPNS